MIWGISEDKLLADYLIKTGFERERIAQKLLPKITQQAEIILKNYFVGYLLRHDVPVLIKEATSNFFLFVHDFNPEYGKAFSFVQQRMMWYYQNYFRINTTKVERFETLDVLPDTQTLIPPFFDVYKESDIITGSTIQHVKSMKVHKLRRPILRHLLSLLVDDVERTYERFVVDLYEPFSKQYTPIRFRQKLIELGFAFNKCESILLSVYTDSEGKGGIRV